MTKVSELNLQWKRREGGGGCTQRDFLDFVVDGQPLSELVGDQVACLGWFVPEENARAVRRLLLEEPADLPNNRRTLYVCPECGDIGCGAVSVVVEKLGNRIIWRDFGFENSYENVIDRTGFGRFGPFTFDNRSYEQTIRRAMESSQPR